MCVYGAVDLVERRSSAEVVRAMGVSREYVEMLIMAGSWLLCDGDRA